MIMKHSYLARLGALTTGLAALWLAACAHAQDRIPDAAGDTFGSSIVAHDVLEADAESSVTSLTLRVWFAGPIAPAGSGPTGLYGMLDLDVDASTDTGGPSFVNVYGPESAIPIGVDYTVDLDSAAENAGQLDVRNSAGEVVGQAAAVWGEQDLTVTVPMELLDRCAGRVRWAVIIGDAADASDKAPNATAPLSTRLVRTMGDAATALRLAAGLLEAAPRTTWPYDLVPDRPAGVSLLDAMLTARIAAGLPE